jgi:tetratricopeptide (TPR) repeat protein
MLRAFVAKTPGAWRSRLVLSKLLNSRGKAEAAANVLRAGIRNRPADFYLWMELGEIRLQLGADGMAVVRTDSYVSYKPGVSAAADKKYKRRQHALALAAFRAAHDRDKGSTEAMVGVGRALDRLGQHMKAARVWQMSVSQLPQNVKLRMRLATSLRKAGKKNAAARAYRHALALEPHLPAAHQALATYYAAQGKPKLAALSKRKATFFGWLPKFLKLRFTARHEKTIAELESKSAAVRKEVLARLVADRSKEATALLAAVCWRHTHHGAQERQAFAALAARKAAGVLRLVVKHGRSVCTIRQGLRALARMKAAGTLKVLLGLLPQDVRPVHAMDIAGSLAVLGDARAVPHLVKVLDRPIPKRPSNAGPFGGSYGFEVAKLRAVAALGYFNTPKAITALKSAVARPKLKIYALVGLYRLTGTATYLAQAHKVLEANPKEVYFDSLLEALLKARPGSKASAFIKALKAHQKAREKASQ